MSMRRSQNALLVLGQEQEAREWFAAYTPLSKDPRISREQIRLNRLKEPGQIGKPRLASAKRALPELIVTHSRQFFL